MKRPGRGGSVPVFLTPAPRDLVLGNRVGFYKIKGDLGSGNFSRVRLASHGLTQGKGGCLPDCPACPHVFLTFSPERVAVKVIDKSKLDAKTTKVGGRQGVGRG